MKVGVVLNPIAGGGRLKRHWPEVAASLNKHFGDFELRETQAEGDAERLALDLAASGFDLVIAAGGDGTASEVADGLLQAFDERGRTTELGLLPCGTGIDFARGLGLPKEVDAVLKRIAEAKARMALVAVANGRFFGGGMMIAPDAELADGQFDIVILRAAGKLKLIWDIRLLYGGRHRNHPAITILRGRKVVVEPLGDVEKNGALVDIDGESPGRIPATFEILPGALTLRY